MEHIMLLLHIMQSGTDLLMARVMVLLKLLSAMDFSTVMATATAMVISLTSYAINICHKLYLFIVFIPIGGDSEGGLSACFMLFPSVNLLVHLARLTWIMI